jgi:2-methylcitrate dehydratase PrpD
MGAAAAGAKLLGLDARQTRMALGIAVSLAGGTRQNFGTMTKAFHAGSAARNGVEAALLAQQGFTAAESIIESPMGFCHLFSGGGSYDSRHASQGLGDPFDVVSPGLSLKPYPCCRFTHRCIDATLYLKKKYGLTADNVAEVQCFTAASLPQILIHSEPKNGLEGKFSMQYCLAAALLDGQVTLASFSDDRVREAKAQELLRRVKYVFTSNATGAEALAAPEKVTIRLRDGRKLSHEVLVPRGDPRNPMTEEERVAKYENCAGVVLSTEAIKKSRDMVLYLDEIEDISELMGLLCFTRKGVV